MKRIILALVVSLITLSGLHSQPSDKYITMAGGNDNVYIPSSSYWNLSADFTISMNLNFTYTNYWQMLMTHSPGGFELSFTGSQLWLSPTGIGWVLQAAWYPQPNTWYHLVVTRIGGTIYAYVDGQLIGTGGGGIGVASSPLRFGNYYVGGYAFYGSMDEVSMWNTGATQTTVTNVLANPLAGNEAGLVGYWKLDETGAGAGISVDNSSQLTGNALDGITQGTATTPYFTSVPIPESSSLCFDGINDYVTIPSNASLNPGENSSWTIEVWVKLPDNLTPMGIITKRQNYSPYAQITLAKNGPNPYNWEAGKRILFIYQSYQSGYNRRICYTNNDIADGQWHHIAAVADDADNQVKIFVDGILQPVTTFGDGGWPSISINEPWLMGSSNDPSGFLDGSVIDVRLWKSARNQSQINEFMFTGISEPENESTLVGYYPCNEGTGQVVNDLSSYSNIGYLGNSVSSDLNDPQWCSAEIPDPAKNSICFDGVDDYVTVPNNASLNPDANGSFTIEAWIKLADNDIPKAIVSKRENSGNISQVTLCQNGPIADQVTTGKRIVLLYRQSSSSVRGGYTANEIVDGNWHHIAAVADQPSNTIRIYVDGIEQPFVLSQNIGPWPDPSNTEPLLIGSFNYPINYLEGSMREIRIWKSVRSQAQINAFMFTTIPNPENETSLVAYYPCDESVGQAINDHSSYSNNGYFGSTTSSDNNDPSWCEGILPLADQNCLDFDGNDDYVNVGNQPGFDMNDAMTIEAWIYPEGPGSGGIAGSGGAIVNKEGEFEIARFSNGYIGWAFANTSPGWAWVQTTAYVPQNLWSHVAMTYGYNVVKTYLNGELVHTYPVSGTIGDVAPTYNDLWISGRQTVVNGQIFDGKIDEVRIWNVVRTESQIRENVYRELPDPTAASGLVAYYRFNAAGGSILPDFSANTYNGALMNMDPLTDWETSTAPIPYQSIANGNWENNAIWNTGQNAPVKAWSRVQADHIISLNTAMEAIDVAITPTGILTINQVQSLTVTGDLVNATGVTGLVLKSGTSGTATLIDNDGPEATVERYFSGNDIDWHLVSSPVANAKSNVFTGMYLQRFDEAANQYVEIIPANVNLHPMCGYAAYSTLSNNNTVAFKGNLNKGNLSLPLTHSATAPYGWNLVGNPYASSIDWNLIIPTLDNVGSTIYYLEAATGNWLTWNGTTGSGSQYIPPMQGFFVSASANTTLNFSNSARTHNGSAMFYKDEVPNLTVIKASGNGLEDRAYIQFSETATPDFDPEKDGYKIISEINPSLPQVFTTAMGKILSINVLPPTEVVPLSFQAGESGMFSISADKANDIPVLILEDKISGEFIDLKQSEHEFHYSVSDIQDRFILHFTPLSTPENPADQIRVFAANNQIYVRDLNNSEGLISIYDITGNLITQDFTMQGGQNTFQVDVSSGYYFVKVTSGNNVITKKIFIR